VNSLKIEPTKRSKCQPEDTLALADHCVAGYQTSKPNSNQFVEKCKNLDLKSATGKACDVVKFTVEDVKKIAKNKDPAVGIYNKGHALRYELENQHQKRLRELMPTLNIK